MGHLRRKKELYTHFKSCVKTDLRHVWKDYEELADDARYTPEYKNLYAKRKETIERVFAGTKEKHGMRYTLYRGLTQVSIWGRLKFAAMNLKKLARWKALHLFLPPDCYFPASFQNPDALCELLGSLTGWSVHLEPVFTTSTHV